jgi:hypothetical protein
LRQMRNRDSEEVIERCSGRRRCVFCQE